MEIKNNWNHQLVKLSEDAISTTCHQFKDPREIPKLNSFIFDSYWVGKKTLKFSPLFWSRSKRIPLWDPGKKPESSRVCLFTFSFGLVSQRFLWGVFLWINKVWNKKSVRLCSSTCVWSISGRLRHPPKNGDGWTHPNKPALLRRRNCSSFQNSIFATSRPTTEPQFLKPEFFRHFWGTLPWLFTTIGGYNLPSFMEGLPDDLCHIVSKVPSWAFQTNRRWVGLGFCEGIPLHQLILAKVWCFLKHSWSI